MENINTFENFDDSYVYVKIPDDHILIDIDVCDEDDFPVRKHSSAARRKKAYLKGKHRYELLRQKNQLPPRKKDSVLRGMTRKTYIANSCKDWLISYGFRKHHNTVRRQWSANEKMNEYAMEV